MSIRVPKKLLGARPDPGLGLAGCVSSEFARQRSGRALKGWAVEQRRVSSYMPITCAFKVLQGYLTDKKQRPPRTLR